MQNKKLSFVAMCAALSISSVMLSASALADGTVAPPAAAGQNVTTGETQPQAIKSQFNSNQGKREAIIQQNMDCVRASVSGDQLKLCMQKKRQEEKQLDSTAARQAQQ